MSMMTCSEGVGRQCVLAAIFRFGDAASRTELGQSIAQRSPPIARPNECRPPNVNRLSNISYAAIDQEPGIWREGSRGWFSQKASLRVAPNKVAHKAARVTHAVRSMQSAVQPCSRWLAR